MGYSPYGHKESDTTELTEHTHRDTDNRCCPGYVSGLPRLLSGKDSACSVGDAGDAGSISGSEDPLAEVMATHSSILAWGIPRTEEPEGLQSIWSQRVGHD